MTLGSGSESYSENSLSCVCTVCTKPLDHCSIISYRKPSEGITFPEQESWKGKCVLSKALESLYVDYTDVNMKQSYKVCYYIINVMDCNFYGSKKS